MKALHLVAVGVASAILIGLSYWLGSSSGAAKFVDNFGTQAGNLIVSLTMIAAIVERSIAVFNTVLFGGERREAEVQVQTESAKLATIETTRQQAQELAARMERDHPAPDFVAALTTAQKALAPALADESVVRANHKEALNQVGAVAQKEDALRVWVGLAVCTFVAMVGVRTLGSLMQPSANTTFFNTVDIVVTAGLLAGGSQGIAQLSDVISKVLSAAKARTGQG